MQPKPIRNRIAAAVLLGVLSDAPQAFAQAAPPAATEAKPPAAPEEGPIQRRQSRSHVLGLRYDLGAASSYGLGYLHVHDTSTVRSHAGVTTYVGYGIEGRLSTYDHSRVDAAIVSAAGRIGAWGHGGGLSIELLAGAGIANGRAIPVGSIGAFFGLYFLELGYSFQVPIASERPEWCASHQFSVRIHMPFYQYALRQWEEPAVRR
ncbi:hypothetical protein KEG38_50355 [Polyangium jinanense]|uniref:hypothetical protein n=1 Tax=Polyangium jinanense TaxID=2829994 RepID=UPI0023419996|nr:hypothetical protein [Polyangium jinanense]MDC3962122.1 hypothetical protein [Polyangium jinanense]